MSNDASSGPAADDAVLKVIVYSDDRTVRHAVRLALGHKVAADLPELEITEFATQAALVKAVDHEHFDLAVLDSEAVPAGGMGIAHQIKDEIPNPPAIVLLVARVADAWLASWSNAEAISPFPVDPVRLPDTVAEVVRRVRRHESTQMLPEVFPAPGQSSRHGADDDHDVPEEMVH
ncbi:response regulator [Propionibacterium sp.]|uniref:response regulator n=1 Tax=Propionibacterium sp. TaxID=1977903 RepID=UPI0039EB4794